MDQISIQPAKTRLSHTLGSPGGKTFTSDLSVSEFALLDDVGYQPLGFVMGTSIYHVGIQVARWGSSQELTVLTQAMYSARELALTRMEAEAGELGADGICGVHIEMNMYAWGQDVLEFIAAGTAVRSKDHPGDSKRPDGKPFTSDLSGQDMFMLAQRGYVPVAFCLGTCVYHVAHQSMMSALKQTGTNVEMAQYTQDIYTARELALSRMQAEAERSSALGIVGTNLIVSNHVWGEHATEFLAMGTAIRPTEKRHSSESISLTLPVV
jgi:uncharacterized protein YbjQ (UPF0145 family)